MNRSFVQLAAILALLIFVLKLNANDDPFDTFIFSGLIFIGIIFIVLIGFYFIRTGLSIMENQKEENIEKNLEQEIDNDMEENIDKEEI